ncbi:hypothetical protein Aperf_G00000062363 [Anoplocephala perfoliata]
MTTETDNGGNNIQKNTPCLPSSVIFPLLSSPIQGDAANRSGVEHCPDPDFKQSGKNYRSLKRSDNFHTGLSSFGCLMCGCVSRNIEETLELPSSVKDRPSVIGTEGQSAETLNNNNPPESPSDFSHDEPVSTSSKDEEKRRKFHTRSPFARLRLFFSKRRRKTESSISDGVLLAADSSSKDNSDGSQSSPHLENDLKEQGETLLGPQRSSDKGKKCFIIDLDETLVHSSFKAVEKADFKVGVEIDNVVHQVYVLKRPYVDEFLRAMADIYECVLFTASLSKYADPVADFLDKWHVFRYRLFRESCVYHRGNYVKDLSQLGRPIDQVVILDNSPASYMFHTTNAVQITSWFEDKSDRALLELIPYFQRLAEGEPGNVVEFLRNNPPPPQFAAVGSFPDASTIGPSSLLTMLTRQPSESSTSSSSAVSGSPFSSSSDTPLFPFAMRSRNKSSSSSTASSSPPPSDSNPITSVRPDDPSPSKATIDDPVSSSANTRASTK